jgi:hypothetical protein
MATLHWYHNSRLFRSFKPGARYAAREAYQVPETGQRLKPGQKLAELYHAKNLPVVRERLVKAAVRLAFVLNEAFPE